MADYEFLDYTKQTLSPFTEDFITNKEIIIRIDRKELVKGSSMKGRFYSFLGVISTPLNLLREIAKQITALVYYIFLGLNNLFELNYRGIGAVVHLTDIALALLLTPLSCIATCVRCFLGIFHPGIVFDKGTNFTGSSSSDPSPTGVGRPNGREVERPSSTSNTEMTISNLTEVVETISGDVSNSGPSTLEDDGPNSQSIFL
jgi:hypothetical protein